MHPSSNNVVFTWGKYKGLTLGYVKSHNSAYLQWIIGADAIPDVWRIASARVLKGEDISDLALPIAKKSALEHTPDAPVDKAAAIEFRLVNKTTATVIMPFNRQLISLFKYEVDGRKWNAEKRQWEFPCAQLIKAVNTFKGHPITIAPEVQAVMDSLVDRRKDLDEIRSLETTKFRVPGLKLDLFDFQNTGVQFIDRTGGRCLIADQPGLGKTAQSIAYAQLHNLKTLIICPLSVVLNWRKEIEKFTGKSATIWDTKGKDGRINSQFHITHYDAASKIHKDLRALECDLLICDEATFLKNRRTIRAKAIFGSWVERKKFPGIKTKHCIFLTGTPVLSRPIEAFTLLNFLDKERFNNFFHFVERYGGWKGAAPMNLSDLHDRTKDLVIRRKKMEVFKDFPLKQRNELYVEMTKDDYKEYQILLKELFGYWASENRPSVQHVPKIQAFLSERKLPRVIEMVDEFLDNERPILIFSCFLEPLRKLQKHYGDQAVIFTGEMNKKSRQKAIDALRDGDAKIGLFSLRAGGMGIDGLQEKIDTVLFLDMDWLAATHEQAEDRTHRMGQKNPVQVYYCICEGTIDEHMRDILKEKQEIASQIVDGQSFDLIAQKSFFRDFIRRINTVYKAQFSEENVEE